MSHNVSWCWIIWRKKTKNVFAKCPEDKTEQRGETRRRQLTLSEQLVTVNGFSVAAEFQVGLCTRRKSAPSSDDLSAVGGSTLDVRSICVVPASLNAPKWADKPLGPPDLHICTARGGRVEISSACSSRAECFITKWRRQCFCSSLHQSAAL